MTTDWCKNEFFIMMWTFLRGSPTFIFCPTSLPDSKSNLLVKSKPKIFYNFWRILIKTGWLTKCSQTLHSGAWIFQAATFLKSCSILICKFVTQSWVAYFGLTNLNQNSGQDISCHITYLTKAKFAQANHELISFPEQFF